MEEKYLKEGFWYNEDKENKNYPEPKPTEDKKWKKKKKFFLNLLYETESFPFVTCRGLKGWSNCRICSERNGSDTFFYKGWEWPSGFSHYIEEHNIKPSKEFIDFIKLYGTLIRLLKD